MNRPPQEINRDKAEQRLRECCSDDLEWLMEECRSILLRRNRSRVTAASSDDGWNGTMDSAIAQYEDGY